MSRAGTLALIASTLLIGLLGGCDRQPAEPAKPKTAQLSPESAKRIPVQTIAPNAGFEPLKVRARRVRT